MVLDYKVFKKHLEKGKWHRFYLFTGEDDYEKRKIIEYMKRRLLKEINTLNFARFYADEFDKESYLSFLRSLSLFENRKLSILYKAEKLDKKSVKDILSTVFTGKATTLSIWSSELSSNEFVKKFSNVAQIEKILIIDFKPLREKDFYKWVMDRLKENKIPLDEEIVESIVVQSHFDKYVAQGIINKILILDSKDKRYIKEIIYNEDAVGYLSSINYNILSADEHRQKDIFLNVKDIFTEKDFESFVYRFVWDVYKKEAKEKREKLLINIQHLHLKSRFSRIRGIYHINKFLKENRGM